MAKYRELVLPLVSAANVRTEAALNCSVAKPCIAESPASIVPAPMKLMIVWAVPKDSPPAEDDLTSQNMGPSVVAVPKLHQDTLTSPPAPTTGVVKDGYLSAPETGEADPPEIMTQAREGLHLST